MCDVALIRLTFPAEQFPIQYLLLCHVFERWILQYIPRIVFIYTVISQYDRLRIMLAMYLNRVLKTTNRIGIFLWWAPEKKTNCNLLT